jgi:hypothetical protein
VNSDATDDVPAERRPQLRARRRRERRRGESKPANEDHKAQPKHTDIIALRVPETRFGPLERVLAGSLGDGFMLLLAV